MEEAKKTKVCSKCGLEKDVSEFNKDKYTKDGIDCQCRSCRKEYQHTHKEEIKKWKEEHREEILEDAKEHYQNNKKELLEDAKEYYEKNKEKILKDVKKYRETHPEEIKATRKKHYQNNREEILEDAKENSKEYYATHKEEKQEYSKQYREIHKKEIKEKAKIYNQKNREKVLLKNYKKSDKKKGFVCDLTEEWLKENITSKPCIYDGETENIGCDRIDNNLGHTKENCVPCCYVCNTARNVHFTHEEMLIIGSTIRQVKEKRKIK